jgi:hypothetical protein
MTYLARDFTFEIDPDGSGFIPIGGIQEWSFSVETEVQDATTVGNSGWKTEVPTIRKAVIECSGFVVVSGTSRNAGQLAVLNAATTGAAVQFRVSTTVLNGSNPIGRISGNAYIELTTGVGGGTADLGEFSFRVHFVGQPTFTGIFA